MKNNPVAHVSHPISIPFLHVESAVNNDILVKQKKRAKELVDNNPEGFGEAWANRCGSWNSVGIYNNILAEETTFTSVTDNLYEYINIFTDAMSMNWENMTPTITESWLNANPPGNVQECHTHPHCYISAVFYIHIPDAGGSSFILDNPLSYEHDVGCNSTSPYTDKVFNVKSGDLIFFPSNVEHHTQVNLSNEYRYSLAFNISTEELLPQYMHDSDKRPW